MNKEERQKEFRALIKAKRILRKLKFTPSQRFWLQKHKPDIFFLKYGNVEENYKPCSDKSTYSISCKAIKNFVNNCNNFYSTSNTKQIK